MVTIIFMLRKRSGSSSVEPSIGANTDMPQSKESPPTNVPGANVIVNCVLSGLTLRVMLLMSTPGPIGLLTLKRFGF